MKKLILFLLMVILASCNAQITEAISIIDVNEFKIEVIGKDVQFVDVRTLEEYNNGHIDDAINIDFFKKESFAEKFEKLDKDKPVYIYCRSGNRSQKSAKILVELGFKKIIDLKGGYTAWRNQ